jgi:hypothetical protein
MDRHHAALSKLIRRLRPSPERFAAAAAVHDPSLLLALDAARVRSGRDVTPTSLCAA